MAHALKTFTRIILILLGVSLVAGQLAVVEVLPTIRLHASDVLVVLLVLVHLPTHIKRSNSSLALLPPLCLFGGIAAVSLLGNMGYATWLSFLIGALYLLRWFVYAYIYIVASDTDIWSAKTWYMWLLGIGLSITSLGFLQYLVYPDLRNISYLGWDPHLYRLVSTLLDPNFAGLVIVLTVVLLLCIGSGIKNILLQIFLLAGLLLTYSRSSIVSLVASLGVWSKLTNKSIVLSMGAVALVVGGLILFTPGGDTLRLNRMDSSIARIENWQQSIELYRKAPILGNGFALSQIHVLSDVQNTVPSLTGAGIDNSLLFVFVSTGLVGGISFVYLLYSWGFKRFKKTDQRSVILAISMIAVLVHSLFVNSLFYSVVVCWLWVLAGLREQRS